jgi:hypothetical protein
MHRQKSLCGATRLYSYVLTDNQFQRIHVLVYGSVKFGGRKHALDTATSALLTELHLHYGMIDGFPGDLSSEHVQLPVRYLEVRRGVLVLNPREERYHSRHFRDAWSREAYLACLFTLGPIGRCLFLFRLARGHGRLYLASTSFSKYFIFSRGCVVVLHLRHQSLLRCWCKFLLNPLQRPKVAWE